MSIDLINSTPFIPLQFESIDSRLNLFGVIAAVGTFDIIDGEPLRLAAEQVPPPLTDEYFGAPAASSLRRPGVLAPYKPKTDVLIEATAHAPAGAKATQWPCGVKAGPLAVSFVVTGPRMWERRASGYTLSAIEPLDSLPIRYDSADGGASSKDADVRFALNPVGVGFNAPGDVADLRCPQVLPAAAERLAFGQAIEPIGLGPVAPSWQPRLGRTGTAGEEWRRTQAPYPPHDFSYEFYNAAQPLLTFPGFATGNEVFELSNLGNGGRLSFALPGVDLAMVIRFEDGRWIPGLMHLDTIEVRVEEKTAFLTWRGIFPASIPTRGIDIRMSAPASMVEA